MKIIYCGVGLLTAVLLAANIAAQTAATSAKATSVPSALRLEYSTFLGGSGEDRAHGMAVDSQGNVYLTAPIRSTDFPTTPDALNRTPTGIYLAKLGPTGALLYSTYLGAAGGINYAHGIALDKEGNIYVVGNTSNASFPTTPGAFQTTFKGPSDGHHGDAFVIKLSPAGNRIIYSTFLGGTGRDMAGQIAVDANGNAYVVGSTSSADFPVTPGAFQTTFRGGESQPSGRGDIFVAKLSPDGSKLVYSTYVGGSGIDIYNGNIVVDAAGRATFAGTTTSADFPVTANAFQGSYRGGSGIRAGGDAIVVRLSPTGTALEYASYVGGRGDDSARSVAVDNDGSVWLAGDTTSDDFPTTPDAYSPQKRGGSDCFFLKLSPRGGPLLYSSLLGGGKSDSLATIAVHASGQLVLTGQTESADFPVTPDADSTTLKGPTDLFVALFDSAGKSLRYGTFLGGSGHEVPGPLVLIKDSVYLAGNTTSTDFPVTPGSGDTTYNGGTDTWGGDAFVARFTLAGKNKAPQESTQPVSADNAPQVTYVANEGFLVELGGKKVLIDSLFDTGYGTYLAPSPEVLEQLTGARGPFSDVDLLLVTHPHGDHFNPKLVVAHMRNNPRSRLIAHTQTVDVLRKVEGFDQIRDRIQEVALAPGAREHVTINGMAVDVLCLPHGPYVKDGRDVHEQTRNLAFFVNMGGTRMLHIGDAAIENSLPYLKAYPFGDTPVDLLFGYFGLSEAAQQLIAQTIKPSRIIAMHVAPAELDEESKQVRAVYPHAIVFKQSMERRSLPIEVDFHNLSGAYFGQTPPGATPVAFAPGIVSTDANEHSAPSFSPDGNEVFWWANRPPGPDNKEWASMSMTMRRENGRWSAPRVTPFGQMVAFSPDGRRAYFGSKDDIWVVEKQGNDWGEPTCLELVKRYPELRHAYMPRVARNGTLYFISYVPGLRNDTGIYRAELINGEYAKPELLPRSINLPTFINWAPFIAPDESYLLFSSNRTGSLDKAGDLYISRRLADGSWTEPVSLGEPVNTPRQEVFPGLSPDGRYLFFARDVPDRENDIYWVDAASIPALLVTNVPVPKSTK